MCTDIFHHVFSDLLPKEQTKNYDSGRLNVKLKLGHILYHLKENHNNLKGILDGESGELFMRYLKYYLRERFNRYRDVFTLEIPEVFLLFI